MMTYRYIHTDLGVWFLDDYLHSTDMVEFFDDYLYTHRLTGLSFLLIIYTQTYRVEFLDYYLYADLRGWVPWQLFTHRLKGWVPWWLYNTDSRGWVPWWFFTHRLRGSSSLIIYLQGWVPWRRFRTVRSAPCPLHHTQGPLICSANRQKKWRGIPLQCGCTWWQRNKHYRCGQV